MANGTDPSILADAYVNELIQRKVAERRQAPEIQAAKARTNLAQLDMSSPMQGIMSGMNALAKGMTGSETRAAEQEILNQKAAQANFVQQQAGIADKSKVATNTFLVEADKQAKALGEEFGKGQLALQDMHRRDALDQDVDGNYFLTENATAKDKAAFDKHSSLKERMQVLQGKLNTSALQFNANNEAQINTSALGNILGTNATQIQQAHTPSMAQQKGIQQRVEGVARNLASDKRRIAGGDPEKNELLTAYQAYAVNPEQASRNVIDDYVMQSNIIPKDKKVDALTELNAIRDKLKKSIAGAAEGMPAVGGKPFVVDDHWVPFIIQRAMAKGGLQGDRLWSNRSGFFNTSTMEDLVKQATEDHWKTQGIASDLSDLDLKAQEQVRSINAANNLLTAAYGK